MAISRGLTKGKARILERVAASGTLAERKKGEATLEKVASTLKADDISQWGPRSSLSALCLYLTGSASSASQSSKAS